MMQQPLRALTFVALAIGIGVLVWMISALIERVHNLVTTIIIAILFAYVIFPAVRLLSTRMPRALAVIFVYVVALVTIGFAIAYLAPAVANEAVDLSRTLPAVLRTVEGQITHPGTSPILRHFPPEVRTFIVQNAARVGIIAGRFAGNIGMQAFAMLRGTATLIVDTFLILTLAFFFIIEAEQIRATFLRLVPRNARTAAVGFIDDVDRVISGFVRGQILLAIVIGIAVSLILLITGVRYATLLGVVAGLASVVPIVGEFIGGLPTFLVALFTVGPIKALIILALFVVVFEVQGRVLAPVVVGRSVGVSPLVIFVSILLGAEAFGLVGMVVAVPVAGIIRVALDRLAPVEEPGELSSIVLGDKISAAPQDETIAKP
jgi:predicted PurR-regulated permease PerM